MSPVSTPAPIGPPIPVVPTYTYNLTCYEKNLDSFGTVVDIFIAILVTDSNDNTLSQEYWLNPDEIAQVLADENNLNSILLTVSALGCENLQMKIAALPQPPVSADAQKLASFTISPDDVSPLVTPVPPPPGPLPPQPVVVDPSLSLQDLNP